MKAGQWSMPFAVGFVAGSMLSPVIARRVRPDFMMGAGLVIAAAGFVALAQVDGSSGLAVIVGSTVVFSLGLSSVFTLANDLIIGALGIAILGSIGTAIYRRAMAGPVVDGIPHEAGVAARDTLGGAVAAAGQFPGPGAALLDTARKAFAEGLQVTAMTSAVVVLGMAILVLVLLRHVRSGSELAAQADRAPERTIADTAST